MSAAPEIDQYRNESADSCVSFANLAKFVDRPSKAPPDNRYSSGESLARCVEGKRVVFDGGIGEVLDSTFLLIS